MGVVKHIHHPCSHAYIEPQEAGVELQLPTPSFLDSLLGVWLYFGCIKTFGLHKLFLLDQEGFEPMVKAGIAYPFTKQTPDDVLKPDIM